MDPMLLVVVVALAVIFGCLVNDLRAAEKKAHDLEEIIKEYFPS
jgi:hypothetical protein